MSLDLTRLRDDTPGVENRLHLNNAGAALCPEPVLAAVREHFELEGRIGGYEAADARGEAIRSVYREVALLVEAQPHQIALMEHATSAFVAALSAVPFRNGDVLLTTRHDYVSNQIQYLSLARRLGVEVVRAPDGPDGGVDVDGLRELIYRRRPRLVAMSHVPTNSGLVQDVAAVGRICRERDTLFLVDACQSVGQMPVDVTETGAHFLSATARKFLRGPRGAGFLWVSDEALDMGLEPLFPDLRGADWIEPDLYQPAPGATRFETWEFAWALVLGLGAAARYARQVGLERIQRRSRALADQLRLQLARVPGIQVLDRGRERCAIVTVAVDGRDPAELVRELRRQGINTSAVTRESAVLDFDEKGVSGALRLSPHYYNTEAEIETAVQALETLARGS
ncbi:MAG: aminotransferase class V-fold PLP-dependent enzyme [Gemmatimonadota bacterium]